MAKQPKPDIVKRVQQRLDLSYMVDRDNRLDAAQDLKFLAGDQWPANVRAEREGQSLPVLTFNRLPQFVNQVVNDFKRNPPAIKATPADDQSSEELVDIYNGILTEIQYRSNAVNVYGTAFGHQVGAGLGHWRITTEYCDDLSFDQELWIKRIAHPLSVFWDPDAVEPDRSDANWCIVTEMMTEEAFREQYPNASISSVDVPTEEQFGASRLYWRLNDMVRIAEYWAKVPVTRRIAMFETGEVVDITDMKKADRQFLPRIVKERSVQSHKVKHWLVSGNEILDGGQDGNDWVGKHIPIIPVIGSEVPLDDKIIRFGLIRFAKDPQMLYNYWRSEAARAIGLQSKAPYLVTPTMIGDPQIKAQWDTHNTKSRPYLLYRPDPTAPGGMPQRMQPPTEPTAVIQESAIANDDMKAITGIYDASLGQRSNETSGRAIMARANQGDIGSYQYTDNFNASLRHCGRVLVDLIPKIYDSERVIRLATEDHEEPQFMPINQVQMAHDGTPMVMNDLSQGKVDVRVRIGPSFESRRLEAVDSMMRFVQAFPQAAQVAGDLIAHAMDWPEADKLAERLKRLIPPQILGEDAPPPSPEQQQQMAQQQQAQQQAQQFQQAMAQVELFLKQAQTRKTMSEADLKDADAMLRKVQTLHAVHNPETQQTYPSTQQLPQDQPQANPMHDDVQGYLASATAFQTLRKNSALADQAEARSQGAMLDNQLKQAKLGGPDRYPLA